MKIANKLYRLCDIFHKKASEDIDYEKASQYGDYIVNYFKISENHPKYKEIENNIIKMLATPEGAEGLTLAYSLFDNQVESGKNVLKKLNNLIRFLRGEVKREMVGYLPPEYAREWINDEDPSVQEIAARALGITFDLEYQDIWKDKEIFEIEENKPTPTVLKNTYVSKETAEQAKNLLNELDFMFGKKDPKLN